MTELLPLARKAIEDNPGDWSGAMRAFTVAVWSDLDAARSAFSRWNEPVAREWLTRASQERHERQRPAHDVGAMGNANSVVRSPLTPSRDAVAAIARRSLLDTFVVAGQPLGDVSAATARTWADARRRDARFIAILTAGIQSDDHRALRHVVTVEDAERAMKLAAEKGRNTDD